MQKFLYSNTEKSLIQLSHNLIISFIQVHNLNSKIHEVVTQY